LFEDLFSPETSDSAESPATHPSEDLANEVNSDELESLFTDNFVEASEPSAPDPTSDFETDELSSLFASEDDIASEDNTSDSDAIDNLDLDDLNLDELEPDFDLDNGVGDEAVGFDGVGDESAGDSDPAVGDTIASAATGEDVAEVSGVTEDSTLEDSTLEDSVTGDTSTEDSVTGELGFDVSAVDVTEDIWAEETDESWLDVIALDESDANPFVTSDVDLSNLDKDADADADDAGDGLDSLFETLDTPSDSLSTSDVLAEGTDEDTQDTIEASPFEADALSEADALFDGSDWAEENAAQNSPESAADDSDGDDNDDIFQLDALFSDVSGTADGDIDTDFDLGLELDTATEQDTNIAADPFNFDELMAAVEPENSVINSSDDDDDDGDIEGDRISSERLNDWDAPPTAPSSSEFDDLLSIGAPPPTDNSDPRSELEDDRPSDRQSSGPGDAGFRSDTMSDAFSDLDTLLGSADADVQADLLDLQSTSVEAGSADDENDPYDIAAEPDFANLSRGRQDEADQIEAAIQNLETADAESGTSPARSGDGQQTTDDFADLEKLLEQADETLGGAPIPSTALRLSSPNRRPVRRPTLGNQTMRVSVKNLDNLNNLVGELVVNRNSLEQSQDRLRQFLDNLMSLVQQMGDLGQRMRDLYERSLLESSLRSSRPQQATSNAASIDSQHVTGAQFDALEMDRFTGFHSLSQEIIELIVRVREAASDIDFVVDESDQGTRTLRQITTQLQEGINHTRMVPFAQAADRLPRAVRDISIKFDKQAELVVEGRDTLVDKMILEQLYDPMTHLVNNAITHGIEKPEDRVAAGKSPVGQITVRAFHQGNQTIISVTDDGAGIDGETVKEKALQRGLISADETETMSQMDTYDLLFRHGFSTRDQADDFAGRGVGMDVVRTSLSEVRGAVNIDSALGQGTTFTIRLPLTLSISKALLCVSDRARIAFPMDGVEDMFDVSKERIQQNDSGQTCIPWRERLLPFRPLSSLLKFNRTISRGSVYGGSQDDDTVSIVVLRSAGNYLALQVDQVLEE
ncbi:MAG: chemotaxis protein CheA, partial [Elainellaceae cyanobacterium]